MQCWLRINGICVTFRRNKDRLMCVLKAACHRQIMPNIEIICRARRREQKMEKKCGAFYISRSNMRQIILIGNCINIYRVALSSGEQCPFDLSIFAQQIRIIRLNLRLADRDWSLNYRPHDILPSHLLYLHRHNLYSLSLYDDDESEKKIEAIFAQIFKSYHTKSTCSSSETTKWMATKTK